MVFMLNIETTRHSVFIINIEKRTVCCSAGKAFKRKSLDGTICAIIKVVLLVATHPLLVNSFMIFT